jgi:hypothetical protein
MPVLKKMEFSETEVFELVKQLDFSKKIALIEEITSEDDYKNRFYAYTESLAQKHDIPEMSEEELDDFLHSQ